MATIHEHECVNLILQNVPRFRSHWQVYQEDWGETEGGSCNDLHEFALYVDDLLADEEYAELPATCALIERFMTDGDADVQWATAHCFLETLLSMQADAEHWTYLLGPTARAYCRAWDELNGIQTPGLWYH